MPKGRFWTEEEDKVIINEYQYKGAKHCAEKLKRSQEAIMHRANRLGVVRKGRIKDPHIVLDNGYMTIKANTTYYRIHRLIMEMILGRKLSSDEIIHHIDGDKMNNHPDNLKLVTRSEHLKVHYPEKGIDEKGRFLGYDIVRS